MFTKDGPFSKLAIAMVGSIGCFAGAFIFQAVGVILLAIAIGVFPALLDKLRQSDWYPILIGAAVLYVAFSEAGSVSDCTKRFMESRRTKESALALVPLACWYLVAECCVSYCRYLGSR